MSSAIQKVKEVLHLDKNHSTTTSNTTGVATHNTHGTVPEGTAGPYSSRIANAADPRVDSDLDGSNRHATTGVMGTSSPTGAYGNTTGHQGAGYSTTGNNVSIADKLNPTIDSQTGLKKTSNTGYDNPTTGAGYGASTGHGLTSSTHAGGMTGTTGPGYNSTAGNNVSIADKLNPTIDSQTGLKKTSNTGYDSSATGAGYGASTGHGLTSSTHTGGLTGTTGSGYNSTTGNNVSIVDKLNPTIDSQTGLKKTSNTGYDNTTVGSEYGSTGMIGSTGTAHHGTHHSHNHGLDTVGNPSGGLVGGNSSNQVHTPTNAMHVGGHSHTHGDGFSHNNGGVVGTGQTTTTGVTGTSQNTVVHDSALLNKLDPRVKTTDTTRY